MKKFVCSVCGYVHQGDSAPEQCPVCKVPAEKFNEMKEDAPLAAEHEYGVYAKTVKNNPDISEEDKKFIYDIQNHLRRGVTFKVNDNSHALTVGRMVFNAGNALNSLLLDKLCDFNDKACLVDHIGNFRDNDSEAVIGSFLNFRS